MILPKQPLQKIIGESITARQKKNTSFYIYSNGNRIYYSIRMIGNDLGGFFKINIFFTDKPDSISRFPGEL
jgi:hypothetical protein